VSTTQPEAEKPTKVELPDGLWEPDQFIVDALSYRGVTPEHIIKWGIRASNDRIYVPITSEKRLVQWLGRSIDRTSSPDKAFSTRHLTRFKYSTGLPISHFLFGWDEAKHWEHVVLVENTFNSIAWRDKINSITNFGSNLSETQANLLKYSKIRIVIFAWDKDAFGKAWNSATKLMKLNGTPTAVIKLIDYKQPDEVPFHLLETAVQELLNTPKAPHHFGPLLKEI